MDRALAHRKPPPAWGDQGRLRNWFHTKAGARFLNAQTSWFRIYAPPRYGLLLTTGRRTGQIRRSSVRVVTRGRRGFLIAIGGEKNDWLQNAIAAPRISMRIGRKTLTGRARRPHGDREAAEAMSAYCERLGWFDYITSLVNQRGFPSPTRIRSMLMRWVEHGSVVIIEFDRRQ